ncbi:MAG: DUF3349 domain-containing protein [Nocardioides sp.]|jgi:hypothetical protein
MDSSAVERVMVWIAGAYPDGVPKADRAGLVGVLRNMLDGEELAEVARGWNLHVDEAASKSEVARVGGVLVAGGWPLAAPARSTEMVVSEGVVMRALGGVVNWLKAGYPEGVPDQDFIPLVAILERRLTKAEMKAVRKDLQAAGVLKPAQEDIADAIESVINESATPQEIARVTAHLRKKGWPVELGGD